MELPNWIKNSKLLKYYDNRIENVTHLDQRRIFEFPKLNTENIFNVLDNILFFGVEDKDVLYKCFEYVVDNNFQEDVKNNFPILKMFYTDIYLDNCEESTIHGNVLSLKYAHLHGCVLGEYICEDAAYHGHVECLEYLVSVGCSLYFEVMLKAMEGHLDCVKFLYKNRNKFDNEMEQNNLWDAFTALETAKGGFLDCLKYAREHGCPWDSRTCYFAAKNGHLDCLKYAIDKGCEIDLKSIMDEHHGHLNSDIREYLIMKFGEDVKKLQGENLAGGMRKDFAYN